ncbi:hypothetical protein F5884DRAFT_862965 [Xylogone sp. PMI_703]|nr:hypothetical protein F5884DRAFT_862965 [Xylogone sp. PMI_703]
MLFSSLTILALASAGLAGARSVLYKRNSDADSFILSPDAIQNGSFNDGSNEIDASEGNQAKSATSHNNFINYCAGKTLTNGLQILTGSCNGIPMGDIPAKDHMISSIITFPTHGGPAIPAGTTFNITVQTTGLITGFFTASNGTYFSAPQTLSNGFVKGHTHITVQNLGKDFNPQTPPDPALFTFFKGITDAGNGQGLVTATVQDGLPAGYYRVCTINSGANHQPALLPVAQRGTADDCTKFVVSEDRVTNSTVNNGSASLTTATLTASAITASLDVA